MSDRKMKRRGGHRAECTKIISSIVELCQQEAEPDIVEINKLKDELNRQHTFVLALDESILGEIDEDDIEDDIAEASAVTMKVKEALAMAEAASKDVPKESKELRHSNVKLPTIVLPKFDGAILRWQHFWDLFDTAIHQRTDLSNASKFHYLLSQLSGEAAQLMTGFNHTDSEYSEAVSLLRSTFGNNKRLIEAHLHTILDLASPGSSARDLGHFRANYEGHLRSLKTIGVEVEAAGFLFTTILLRKLPSNIRDRINREGSSDFWDLQSLRGAIEIEIGHLEAHERGIHADHSDWLPSGNLLNPTLQHPLSTVTLPLSAKAGYPRRCQLCESAKHVAIKCDAHKSGQERRAQAMKMKLCFNCLRAGGHRANNCTSQTRCKQCHRKHHTSLCSGVPEPASRWGNITSQPISASAWSGDQEDSTTDRKDKHRPPARGITATMMAAGGPKIINIHQDAENLRGEETLSVTPSTDFFTQSVVGGVTSPQRTDDKSPNSQTESSVLLPTAMMTIRCNGGEYVVRSLFDLGSQKTFILQRLAKQFKLVPSRTVRLTINGFGGQIKSRVYNVVCVTVLTENGGVLVEAVVVDHLPDNIFMPGRSAVVKSLKCLGIRLADGTDNTDHFKDVGILIGADQYYSFVYSNIVEGISVIPSKLGCLVSGNVRGSVRSEACNTETVTVLEVGVSDDLDSKLERLWRLDSVGICDTSDYPPSEAFDNFKECVRFENGKYIATLPWKNNHPQLPTNYYMSLRRLQSNLAHLRRDPEQLMLYDRVIRGQLDRDLIERVVNPENYQGKVHYLSHHGVKKDSATTPLRVVFDCSARASKDDPSLNDCLCSGPSLNNEMVSVLMRFRSARFASSSDIEKAYLQVALQEGDRDVTRFMWPDDPFEENSKINIYRFRVVFFGATCSQFLLNLSLKCHLEGSADPFAGDIADSLYIDNLLYSTDSEATMLEFYDHSNSLLCAGGFKLQEWRSNSKSMCTRISGDLGVPAADHSDVNVLGMKWDTRTDQISFNVKPITEVGCCSKRLILSEIAKLYDPLGVMLPVTIRARMLLQELWRNGVTWDEVISPELTSKWRTLSKDLNLCQTLSFPRNISMVDTEEIHVFSDASTKAFGAVVYAKRGPCFEFVIAKARLVPIKAPTLPQLELTAANLAARLAAFVMTTYGQSVVNCLLYMWTDSQVVLSWLKSSRLSKQYVRQRVDNIKQLIPCAVWQYISTSDNPADVLTRGTSASKLLTSSCWLRRPEWLSGRTEEPICADSIVIGVVSGSLPGVLHGDTNVNYAPVIDTAAFVTNYVEGFSSFTRLIRVTAYVLRFVRLAKLRRSERPAENSFLSVSELRVAEGKLTELTQRNYFSDVFQYFEEKTKFIPPLVRQLRLKLENRLIVCGGRLELSCLSATARVPILLPSNAPFTNLVIIHAHKVSLHAGVNHTLSVIRDKYWIPRGRQRVKAVLGRCTVCKRQHGRTVGTRSVAPLPEFRVVKSVPFEVTGVDYTGALIVRNESHISKVYICLFTCMTSRAIHLELVEDGSGEAFMRAFRRFVARRSCPKFIVSDNASVFCASAVNLRNICRSETVIYHLSNLDVQWKFIPARAPHFGGVWEVLIGKTKATLHKVLGRALVSFVELNTLICEIECCINDRPLMYIGDEIEEPITPAHLMHGRRLRCLGNAGVDFQSFEDPSLYERPAFTKREQRIRLLLEHFWSRWKEEYLKGLRERDRHLINSSQCSLSIGDIVLIHDDKARALWNLGKILELHRGVDGVVRSVTLKTRTGKITRPIIKLLPLEISSSEVQVEGEALGAETVVKTARQAAVRAKELIAQSFR